MKVLGRSLTTLFVLIVTLGCASPYYGHSEEDWYQLSEEERSAIKEEYQLIVDSKRDQAHKDIIDARTQSIIDFGVGEPKY